MFHTVYVDGASNGIAFYKRVFDAALEEVLCVGRRTSSIMRSPSVHFTFIERPQGFRVRFTTAAALVNELIEARDDKRL